MNKNERDGGKRKDFLKARKTMKKKTDRNRTREMRIMQKKACIPYIMCKLYYI